MNCNCANLGKYLSQTISIGSIPLDIAKLYLQFNILKLCLLFFLHSTFFMESDLSIFPLDISSSVLIWDQIYFILVILWIFFFLVENPCYLWL